MSEWCQNKKCPQKKTQSQIRGSKGHKYYQSNKAKDYYFHMSSTVTKESIHTTIYVLADKIFTILSIL